jgi:hypothetical protein
MSSIGLAIALAAALVAMPGPEQKLLTVAPGKDLISSRPTVRRQRILPCPGWQGVISAQAVRQSVTAVLPTSHDGVETLPHVSRSLCETCRSYRRRPGKVLRPTGEHQVPASCDSGWTIAVKICRRSGQLVYISLPTLPDERPVAAGEV